MNIENLSIKMKTWAPGVLRIGMSLIIIWFGIQQITDTVAWIGFLPDWTSSLPVSATTLITLNGAVEILLGIFMFAGFYTRIAAFILALHLFDITFVVGYNAIGMRDLGLSIALTAIFLYGHDAWTFDFFHAKRYGKDSSGNPSK